MRYSGLCVIREFLFCLLVCTVHNTYPIIPQDRKRQIVIVKDVLKRHKLEIGAHRDVERLSRMTSSDFKREFSKLHVRMKVLYLLSLDIEQYECFLLRYKDEQEWTAFWKGLSQEEKRYIPETLQVQQRAIRNCYYKLCPSTSWIPFYGQRKAANPTDLRFWKKLYYQEGVNYTSPYPFNAEILLHNDFLRRKYKMLHINT